MTIDDLVVRHLDDEAIAECVSGSQGLISQGSGCRVYIKHTYCRHTSCWQHSIMESEGKRTLIMYIISVLSCNKANFEKHGDYPHTGQKLPKLCITKLNEIKTLHVR